MIEKYKEWLQNIRRLSPNTIRVYIERIKVISKNLDLENLTEEKINKFLSDFTKDKSKSTLNGYINVISSFLKFQKKDIPIPKVVTVKNKRPEHITNKEFHERVIPILEYYFEKDVLKMKALLTFMFYTGARVSDIVNLKRTDMDFENKYVFFKHGKGEKEREVPLLTIVVDIANKYFITESEKQNAFNITESALRQKVKKIKDILGDIEITPHTFRHSFAIWYLNEFDGNIRNLQKLMGHNDIKTTTRYLEIKNKDMLDYFKEKEKKWMKKRKG